MKKCAICNSPVTRDDAPILTMDVYGNPRCLCDACDRELTVATEGEEYSEIVEAIEKVGRRVAESSLADRKTLVTVKEILSTAGERAEKIRDGEYDFSADEAEDGGFDEIPEELLETEEDRELDRAEEVRNQKFDKIFNWVAGIAIGAAAAFVIYRFLDAYLF